MRTIARFMDARNTAEGKFLSVLLSVLLVFSFLNVTMFTDYAGADTTPEGDGTEIVTPLEDVEEPEAQPGDEADGPESEEPAEEVNETEPAAEPEAPAAAEEPEAAAEETPAPEAYEGYAHVGNITVKVTAEAGVVPAGTEVHAKEVNDPAVKKVVEEALANDSKALAGYAAIDVTLVKEGQEIQPDGKVNVCFFDTNVKGDSVSVFHVADDASSVTEIDARQADAAVQSFDVEHFSIYVVAGEKALVGKTDPIDIKPVDQKIVRFDVKYASGAMCSTTSAAAVAKTVGGEKVYVLDSYKLELPEGVAIVEDGVSVDESGAEVSYDADAATVTLSSGSGASAIVTVVVAGVQAEYKVVHAFQSLSDPNSYEVREDLGQVKTGTVGTPTYAEPIEGIEGFTAKVVEQKAIAADGTTVVEVKYDRNVLAITYDSMGGSYVKRQTGYYGQTKTIYSEASESEKELTCTRPLHVHDAQPSYRPWSGETSTNGCWRSKGYAWEGLNWVFQGWEWVCSNNHTEHNDSCYTTKTTVTTDPAPVKEGYTFDGWYLDAECTEKAPSNMELLGDVTVYAKWNAKEVGYQVSYFAENADDDGYSYVGTVAKSALAGSTVTETTFSAMPASVGIDVANFHFGHATTQTVSANGSTVVCVYYDRNVYTLISNKSFTINGKNQKLTLTAKYGATITDLMNKEWNTPTNNKYAWSLTNVNEDKVAVFDTMPSGDMPSGEKTVYSHEYSTQDKQTLSYWLENYSDGQEKKCSMGRRTACTSALR